MAGPTVRQIWKVSWLSASPADSWPAGSRCGVKVRRAGLSTALTADWTATRTYSHSWSRPANACAANSAEMAARQLLVTRTSLRRSKASAKDPPNSPTTSVGIILVSPSAPTANAECVSS